MGLELSRVTVATVVDDRTPYTAEVLHLFASLEVFGGVMRNARRRAYFINDVSKGTRERLGEFGVDVRVVPEVEPRFRFANKLAMFSAEAEEDTDLLIGLDTDIVVAGDFSPYLDANLIQAKPPDGDLLSMAMWKQLFDHFGLRLPPARYPTSLYPGWTHAYFNTGVLMVPGSSLTDLHAAWLEYIGCFIEGFPALEAVTVALRDRVPVYEQTTADDLRSLFYAEQWAFALAVSDLALPYSTLPLALNFPTIYNGDHRPGEYIRKRLLPHAIAPLLIHHHHNFEGGLEPTGYDKPDRMIEQVNEAILRRPGAGAGDGDPERGGGRAREQD